jgi:hypothetical protein
MNDTESIAVYQEKTALSFWPTLYYFFFFISSRIDAVHLADYKAYNLLVFTTDKKLGIKRSNQMTAAHHLAALCSTHLYSLYAYLSILHVSDGVIAIILYMRKKRFPELWP